MSVGGLGVPHDDVGIGDQLALIEGAVLAEGPCPEHRVGVEGQLLPRPIAGGTLRGRGAVQRIGHVGPGGDLHADDLFPVIHPAGQGDRGRLAVGAPEEGRGVGRPLGGRLAKAPAVPHLGVAYTGHGHGHAYPVDEGAAVVVEIEGLPLTGDGEVQRPRLHIGGNALLVLAFKGKAAAHVEDEISFPGDTRSLRKNPFRGLFLVVCERIAGEVHGLIGAVVELHPLALIVVVGHALGVQMVPIAVREDLREGDVVNAYVRVALLVEGGVARRGVGIARGGLVRDGEAALGIEIAVGLIPPDHAGILLLGGELVHIEDAAVLIHQYDGIALAARQVEGQGDVAVHLVRHAPEEQILPGADGRTLGEGELVGLADVVADAAAREVHGKGGGVAKFDPVGILAVGPGGGGAVAGHELGDIDPIVLGGGAHAEGGFALVQLPALLIGRHAGWGVGIERRGQHVLILPGLAVPAQGVAGIDGGDLHGEQGLAGPVGEPDHVPRAQLEVGDEGVLHLLAGAPDQDIPVGGQHRLVGEDPKPVLPIRQAPAGDILILGGDIVELHIIRMVPGPVGDDARVVDHDLADDHVGGQLHSGGLGRLLLAAGGPAHAYDEQQHQQDGNGGLDHCLLRTPTLHILSSFPE